MDNILIIGGIIAVLITSNCYFWFHIVRFYKNRADALMALHRAECKERVERRLEEKQNG